MIILTSCQQPAYHECVHRVAAKASSKQSSPPALRRVVRFRRRGASRGLVASDTPDLMRQIERGFCLEALLRPQANSALSLALLATVFGIPERSLARRKTT